jgi:hypothetical protein
MQETSPIFYILVLIISVIIHEIAHGYAALHYGDHTAEYQGRLTLNPLKHLDPYGSVILPLLLLLTHAPFLIGWAKPVPYNPDNFNPANRRNFSFKISHTRFLRVVANQIFNNRHIQCEFLLIQTMSRHLFRNKMSHRNLNFFFFGRHTAYKPKVFKYISAS